MHATNTSSTKSQIIWQEDLKPSKLFAAIYLATTLLALFALWQCPVQAYWRILLIGITGLGAVLNFYFVNLVIQYDSTLCLFDDKSWLLKRTDSTTRGYLASGSYRSLLLVIVAIKPDNGRTQHAVIWRDSVTPSSFSFLHIHLAMTPSQQLS